MQKNIWPIYVRLVKLIAKEVPKLAILYTYKYIYIYIFVLKHAITQILIVLIVVGSTIPKILL